MPTKKNVKKATKPKKLIDAGRDDFGEWIAKNDPEFLKRVRKEQAKINKKK